MSYDSVYSQCQALWSLEVKRPRTSMTFESVALKWACVSRHVFLSFTCLFWVKLWSKISKDHSRVLEEGPKVVLRLSKVAPNYWGNRRLVGQSTTHRWVLLVENKYWDRIDQFWVSEPIGWRTWWSVCGHGFVLCVQFTSKWGVKF